MSAKLYRVTATSTLNGHKTTVCTTESVIEATDAFETLEEYEYLTVRFEVMEPKLIMSNEE